MAVSSLLRKQVLSRSNYYCEYRKTSSRITGMPLVVEHVCPKSLGGKDHESNLAAACYRCGYSGLASSKRITGGCHKRISEFISGGDGKGL